MISTNQSNLNTKPVEQKIKQYYIENSTTHLKRTYTMIKLVSFQGSKDVSTYI
jgi:hypothetical protein